MPHRTLGRETAALLQQKNSVCGPGMLTRGTAAFSLLPASSSLTTGGKINSFVTLLMACAWESVKKGAPTSKGPGGFPPGLLQEPPACQGSGAGPGVCIGKASHLHHFQYHGHPLRSVAQAHSPCPRPAPLRLPALKLLSAPRGPVGSNDHSLQQCAQVLATGRWSFIPPGDPARWAWPCPIRDEQAGFRGSNSAAQSRRTF